jgi:hypothetical protein
MTVNPNPVLARVNKSCTTLLLAIGRSRQSWYVVKEISRSEDVRSLDAIRPAFGEALQLY